MAKKDTIEALFAAVETAEAALIEHNGRVGNFDGLLADLEVKLADSFSNPTEAAPLAAQIAALQATKNSAEIVTKRLETVLIDAKRAYTLALYDQSLVEWQRAEDSRHAKEAEYNALQAQLNEVRASYHDIENLCDTLVKRYSNQAGDLADLYDMPLDLLIARAAQHNAPRNMNGVVFRLQKKQERLQRESAQGQFYQDTLFTR